MSEEVTKIIDTLCEKLGVAASYLIPELAKKNIAQDVVGVIVCVFALGGGNCICALGNKEEHGQKRRHGW